MKAAFSLSAFSISVLIVASALPAHAADEEPIRAEVLTAAIEKSLPLLEAGARGSMEQRKQCFTCHNQGLPIIAMTAARTRGFTIDEPHLESQLRFIADFLEKHRDRFVEGKGTGGQADTAGYALWALAAGRWPADEATEAVAEYLLLYQQDRDHWASGARRPPTEQSPFTTTYVALRGLKSYGTASQQQRIDNRLKQVDNWLRTASANDTEDRVFRLRALHLLDPSNDLVQQAQRDLIDRQRDDGGWPQLDDMDSDAYATGSVLAALYETGGLSPRDSAYQRGLRFLLDVQHEDGSWHVTSRSDPFQTYFESGYPHGKDQFISIAAASWATAALIFALPEQAPAEQIGLLHNGTGRANAAEP